MRKSDHTAAINALEQEAFLLERLADAYRQAIIKLKELHSPTVTTAPDPTVNIFNSQMGTDRVASEFLPTHEMEIPDCLKSAP